jgi:hypothetical protein
MAWMPASIEVLNLLSMITMFLTEHTNIFHRSVTLIYQKGMKSNVFIFFTFKAKDCDAGVVAGCGSGSGSGIFKYLCENIPTETVHHLYHSHCQQFILDRTRRIKQLQTIF